MIHLWRTRCSYFPIPKQLFHYLFSIVIIGVYVFQKLLQYLSLQ